MTGRGFDRIMGKAASPAQPLCVCRYCKSETTMLGTGLCDRCWEMRSRIEADPGLARKILAEVAP